MHVLQAGRCRAGGQHSSRASTVASQQPSLACRRARGSPARRHVVQLHAAVSSKHQNADVVSSGAGVQRQVGQSSPGKPELEEDRELHRWVAWGLRARAISRPACTLAPCRGCRRCSRCVMHATSPPAAAVLPRACSVADVDGSS